MHTLQSAFLLWVDEAGRGSWAGPVVAGACALREWTTYSFSPLLDDSKKLSPKNREKVFSMLQESLAKGECFGGVGIIGPEIIDRVGIREANRLAMQEAMKRVIAQIWGDIESIRIDGKDNYRFENIDPKDVKYVIRGDSFIPEIQAASILAKVSRDRLMIELSESYPDYGFEKHKGYGTRLHETLLQVHGPADMHRKSYAPIKKLILEGEWILSDI